MNMNDNFDPPAPVPERFDIPDFTSVRSKAPRKPSGVSKSDVKAAIGKLIEPESPLMRVLGDHHDAIKSLGDFLKQVNERNLERNDRIAALEAENTILIRRLNALEEAVLEMIDAAPQHPT